MEVRPQHSDTDEILGPNQLPFPPSFSFLVLGFVSLLNSHLFM